MKDVRTLSCDVTEMEPCDAPTLAKDISFGMLHELPALAVEFHVSPSQRSEIRKSVRFGRATVSVFSTSGSLARKVPRRFFDGASIDLNLIDTSSTNVTSIGANSIDGNGINVDSAGMNSSGVNRLDGNGINVESIDADRLGVCSVDVNGINADSSAASSIDVNCFGVNCSDGVCCPVARCNLVGGIGMDGIDMNSTGATSIEDNSIDGNGINVVSTGMNGIGVSCIDGDGLNVCSLVNNISRAAGSMDDPTREYMIQLQRSIMLDIAKFFCLFANSAAEQDWVQSCIAQLSATTIERMRPPCSDVCADGQSIVNLLTSLMLDDWHFVLESGTLCASAAPQMFVDGSSGGGSGSAARHGLVLAPLSKRDCPRGVSISRPTSKTKRPRCHTAKKTNR
mmetsp:Transcript_133753/g.416010  ORF Transcript_133753/g.416010 Transcript_133753/m.416010 type:complete len:396 (-) Transcript_133753:90-1277(-)